MFSLAKFLLEMKGVPLSESHPLGWTIDLSVIIQRKPH